MSAVAGGTAAAATASVAVPAVVEDGNGVASPSVSSFLAGSDTLGAPSLL